MKHSKILDDWRRKRLYGEFIKIPIVFRMYLYNNSFELFCKRELNLTYYD